MDTAWTGTYAGLFCVGNAGIYVGSMYLIPKSVRSLPRDNINHIKYRAVAVTIATLLSVLVFTVLVPTADVSAALGLSGNRIGRSLITTFSLMTIFYLGPLATLLHYTSICHEYIVAPDGTLTQRSFIPSLKQYAVGEVFPNFWSEFRRGSELDRLIHLRALLVAPVTEEIVFRAVMVPALYLAFVGPPAVTGELIAGSAVTALSGSPWNVVWANPFCFGLAHAHHFVEKIRSGTPVVNALKITAAQLAYTSIFGVVATILFMRIGNIYSAILSHIICNSVGLPDVAFCNSPGNRKSDFYSCMYPYRYLHLMIHLIGLLLFTVLLFPFTEQFVADSLYWK